MCICVTCFSACFWDLFPVGCHLLVANLPGCGNVYMAYSLVCIVLFVLGAYANLRKAAPTLTVFVRKKQLRSPLDGFSWNLIFEDFSKIWQQNSSLIEIHRLTGNLHEHIRTFMVVSRSVLLRMRNVSDKSCRENQNTHFVFSNFFPNIVLIMS